MYHSQYNQDKFLDENVFKQMTGGVFLEMGADDGVIGSNTLFFERERGWSGLCIEPRRSAYEKLIKNRNCQTVNAAISADKAPTKKFLEVSGEIGQLSGLVDTFEPQYMERVRGEATTKGIPITIIDMPSMMLNDVLEKYGLYRINYFSLDTEGGELKILQSIDYNRFHIDCISVENPHEDKKMSSFLDKKGYTKLTRIKIDDIFILRTSPFNTYKESFRKKSVVQYKKLKRYIKKLIGHNT